MRKRYGDGCMVNKYIYFGIIGAVLLGIGDWLLGYVDPTPMDGMPWDWLVQGYAAGYQTERSAVTMALSTPAVLFYLPCMWHMGSIFPDRKIRKKNGWLMVAGSFGGLVVHYFFAVMSFLFAWLCENADLSLAGTATTALKDAMFIGVASWYPIMAASYLVHFIDMFRGKSFLPKRMLFFHPLVWWVMFCIIPSILPTSAFANGLFTFSVNGAMLVWLAALLIHEKVNYP